MSSSTVPGGLRQPRLSMATAKSLLPRLPLLLVLVVLVVAGALLSHGVFLRTSNIVTVLYQYSVTGLLALGELFVILTGGIDLSVGAVVILAAVFAGDLSQSQNLPVVLPRLSSGAAVVVALAVAAGIGLVNGVVVAFTRIPPFIVTLATMLLCQGLALWLTAGEGVSGSSFFSSFGGALLGSIPVPVIVVVAIFLCAGVLIRKMTYGMLLYAVGSNETASRIAGAPVRGPKIVAYTVCGLLAGAGGIVYLARNATAIPGTDNTLLLGGISAVIVGGVALEGGRGGISAPVLGTLILAALGNIMNLELVSPSMQSGVQGAIIIAAVAANVRLGRRRTRGTAGGVVHPKAPAPELAPEALLE